MELVCAGLRCCVENGSAVPAVFRVDRVGDQIHFGNGIGVGNNLQRVQGQIIRIRSVDQIAVGLAASAIGRIVSSEPVGSRYDTRQCLLKLDPIAPVQRKIHASVRVNVSTQLDALGFNLCLTCLNGDALGKGTEFQRTV